MQSPVSIPSKSERKPLHIIATSPLANSEVLATFSDGSSAIYEAEELEKLRPRPKRVLPAPASGNQDRFADVA